MLQIRPEQVEALDRLALRLFEERVEALLRATHGEETAAMPQDQLRALVHAGIKRAARYGLELEDDVQRFIERLLLWGPEFDHAPEYAWAREILDTPDLNGSEKMDRIAQHEVMAELAEGEA